ncbi:hypothetical protein P280DRAFT_88309 [Massarina eburnea CBS 473.64]|uniref:Uncharacterized protein n=1 Tax=Massarina eburnea CBS 473.64 TaxID=1395130 RepID=A0A6A6RTK6_9PLEO|nr:hypothetical protein P280DRAFT_88309 [Massarina eburnea CBS 473.64]
MSTHNYDPKAVVMPGVTAFHSFTTGDKRRPALAQPYISKAYIQGIYHKIQQSQQKHKPGRKHVRSVSKASTTNEVPSPLCHPTYTSPQSSTTIMQRQKTRCSLLTYIRILVLFVLRGSYYPMLAVVNACSSDRRLKYHRSKRTK